MNREKLKKMAADPNNIPGIYNYCDRWCDRCPFTARCLNYKMNKGKSDNRESHDATNAVFWENLSANLHRTMELLRETAKEQGFDLDARDEAATGQYRDEFEDTCVIHIIEHMAKSYIAMVDEWFDNDMSPADTLALLSDEDRFAVQENTDVIRWYQHHIFVKLRRALKSARMEKGDDWYDDQKDSDGSAKVALIGIDRSISAWGKFLNFFPWHKESVFNNIAHLKRLSKITEDEFPEARWFVRPGFDEVHS